MSKSYKDTLNLPKTAFDMRAGLLKKEPRIQEQWAKEDLYDRIRHRRAGAPRFILHDGPPYANGNIHMGTALNKVLKDMVVRYKTMAGFDAPYIPGWDCHGLPIEHKVMEELKADGASERQEAMDVRRRCGDYAGTFATLQSDQFQRLGCMGAFDDPYITMRPQYEAGVLEVFARLVDAGIVYRQLKPVHWSIENRTALADAELEYHDREDTSIYVAFPLAGDAPDIARGGDAVSLLIWTTTPWTLPANLAVAVHPRFHYAAVRVETADGPATWLLAAERVEPTMHAIRAARGEWLKSHDVLETFEGARLLDANVRYRHPLIEGADCPLVAADYVTLEEGTGLVHTAPGHGTEDYGTALKAGLEIYCPVGPDGTFDETAPEALRGVNVWDANAQIVEDLRRRKLLACDVPLTHSYPHDWRSKTPTIFRATEQWFIAVDRPLSDSGRTLRDLAMEACRRTSDDGGIDFTPAWGRNRISGMLESRPDWCISRQRAWGLPIPVFYNADGAPLLTPASVRAVARHVAERGSDAWFTDSPADLLGDYDASDDPDVDAPEAFAVKRLTRGEDIFDVWFESGSSWFAAAMARGLVDRPPVDLYLEGSDQHRGWFQLSLLPALASEGHPPFAALLTHGFVVTEDGRKMSKSLGNAIDVIEQLDRRGADILRLWIASQNYQDDVRCSERLIAQAEDAYRKIRNTLRFCMGACADLDPAHHATEPDAHSIDRWMRLEMHGLIRDVRAAYDAYEFHRATRLIYEFCTTQASSVYLSAVKDRLYCELPDSDRRRATQTVIHELLVTLVKLLAPILPHTAEEAWKLVPFRAAGEPDSVHLADLPTFDAGLLDAAEELRPVNPDIAQFSADHLEAGPQWIWDRLLDLRQAGLAKLEALRETGVKNPLDAEAVFRVAPGNDAAKHFCETYRGELEDMLGVGHARIEAAEDLPDGEIVDVDVLDARQRYARCERSWKRRPDVGSDPDYPDLSARDAAAVKALRDDS
ncbi:MAG: isoleucine--tRNA ligase [Phycisphaerae bacterium]|nr:isoleucine--tRNA ligase [Phycisphaerae bacterium]